MQHGPSPQRVRELSTLFGVDRRTIARWQAFWHDHFPKTHFWKVASARLALHCNLATLTLLFLAAFVRHCDDHEGWGQLFRFSLSNNERDRPAELAFAMIAPGLQGIRFLLPGWRIYRGCRGPFTYFFKRHDDQNTQKFDRRPVGAFPILHRRTVTELTSCAGKLKTAIRSLAEKTWRHPVTGCDVQITAVSIERWYYMARRKRDDPLCISRPAVRKDCGKVSLSPVLAERFYLQYRDHPHWSYQLHYDNFAVLVEAEPSLG